MTLASGGVRLFSIVKRVLAVSVISIGLPVLAQSYQSSFSDPVFDVARGPKNDFGGVTVDPATGQLSYNIPVGPGIGARGAVFRPVLRGQSSYRRHYVETLIFPDIELPVRVPVLDSQDYLSGGWAHPYVDRTNNPGTYDETLTVAPGILELPVSTGYRNLDRLGRFQVGETSGTFNMSPVSIAVDPTQILAKFGYAGNVVAAPAPWVNVPPPNNMICMASGRYLVMALGGAEYPTQTVTDAWYLGSTNRLTSVTISYPSGVLVVDGDVAYEFALPACGTPIATFWTQSTTIGTYPIAFYPISRFGYVLKRVRNASGDELRFGYSGGNIVWLKDETVDRGERSRFYVDAPDIRVEWFRNGQPTDTFIHMLHTAPNYKVAYHSEGQTIASYTYSGASNLSRLGSGSLILDQTTDEVAIKLGIFPSGRIDGILTYKKNDQILRRIDATWGGEYSYLNTDGFTGRPVRGQHFTVGVTRLDDKVMMGSSGWVTRTTTYDRTIPRPLYYSIEVEGGLVPSEGGTELSNPLQWQSTDFSCRVTHSDGTSVKYTYAAPTAYGQRSPNFMAFTKNLVAKEEWFGSNGTLAKVITSSLWDLKAIGDTEASSPSSVSNAVPYPTHVETRDLLSGSRSVSDLQQWDGTHFSWNRQAQTITDLSGGNPMDRTKTTVPSSNPTLFLWNRTTEERRVGLPPVFRTWEPTQQRVLDETHGEVGGPQTHSHSTWTDGLLDQVYVEFPGDPGSRRGMNYGYDALGQLNAMWPLDPSLAHLKVTRTLDGLGRVKSSTDANDLSSTFGWDAAGRMTTVTPPGNEVGTVCNFDSDPLTTIQTRGDQKTTHVYNGWGEPLRVIRETRNGTLSHQAFGYDARGRKIWTSVWRSGSGASVDWTAAFSPDDTQGAAAWTETTDQCASWQRNPDGTSTCRAYKTILHPAVPPTYVSTHFQYDEHNRVTQVVSPTNETKTITYTSGTSGYTRTSTVVPSAGVSLVTTETFDTLGRLVKITDAKGQDTQYTYDEADRIKTVTQWSGIQGTLPRQDRTWHYDALGRMDTLVQPESGTTSYSDFDVSGKPWTTNYNGRIVRSAFDGIGRLKSILADDETVNQNFTYDEGGKAVLANGKLTTATAIGGTRTLAYSGPYGLNGRLTSITRMLDGQSFSQTMRYDSYGRLIRRSYPDGKVQDVHYQDDTGNPDWTNFNSGRVASFAYHDTTWGLLTVAFQNGAFTDYSYRSDQTTLATMRHTVPGKLSKIWTYGYDGAGRLLTDGEDSFTYDSLGRLKTAAVADLTPDATGLFQTFDYDAFGNRILAMTETATNWTPPNALPGTVSLSPTLRAGLDAVTANTTFGKSDSALLKNQMPAFTSNGAATGAQYDPQGNLANVFTTPNDTTTNVSMTYDALGRVTSLTSKAGPEQYLYDEEGLRIRIWDGTKYRYNIYNEARQLIAQYEKTKKADGTWNDPVWKKDIIYVGTKEIAEVSPTDTSITMTDHLGSPRFIWAGGSNPVIKQKFLPFGEQLGTAGTAKGFTNHEATDASGLIYMQARFYLPMWGRFASPDPARDQHFEQTQSWNIYSYVRNNPVMMTDPTGMYVWSRTLGGSADDSKLDSTTLRLRNDFRKGLSDARAAVGKMENGTEKTAALNALSSYGNEGENNKVFIGVTMFAPNSGTHAEATNNLRQVGNGPISLEQKMAFEPGKLDPETVIHEGTHLYDGQNYVSTRNSMGKSAAEGLNYTNFDREIRAFETEFSVMPFLGRKQFPDNGSQVVWDIKMGPQDVRNSIKNMLRTNPVYNLTESNPGGVIWSF